MEADLAMAAKVGAQTQFEADQSKIGGMNEKAWQSGNNLEGTEENLDFKNSQECSEQDDKCKETEALSRKDCVETHAETDQGGIPRWKASTVTDGNNQKSLAGNFVAGNSQDWVLPSKDVQESEQRIVDSMRKSSTVPPLHESPDYSGSPSRDTRNIGNKDDSIPGKDESQTVPRAQKVEDENFQAQVSPTEQVQQCEQWITDSPREFAIALPLHESKNRLVRNEGHSISGTEESGTLPTDHQVEDRTSIGEGDCRPRQIVSSEMTEVANIKRTDTLAEEVRTTDESKTDSVVPYIASSMLKRNVSKNSQPFSVSSSSDSGQQQSPSNGKHFRQTETMPSSQSIEDNAGFQKERDSFLDPSNQEWSDLDFGGGEATYVSNDLEGWQRFDTEEVITGVDSTSSGINQRELLWEHLLDDHLENDGENNVANYLQLASPSAFKENQAELASPGNPFIEELERRSSFSDADGLVDGKELLCTDRPSHVIEGTPHVKEGLIDERASSDPPLGNETGTEVEKNAVQSSTQNEHRKKLHLQSSSSLDFMEPFEAPSFMSLVDPKSHALFEASMPTYQANLSRNGHESGEGKWVANFDLVAPSTQEIKRSISMPRLGSDVPDQQSDQSVSFNVNREQDPKKRENEPPSVHRSLSGLLPPKLSPLVQKVVDKVRNTPAAANGVFNSVWQVMNPKASKEKPTSGSFLTRWMCW